MLQASLTSEWYAHGRNASARHFEQSARQLMTHRKSVSLAALQLQCQLYAIIAVIAERVRGFRLATERLSSDSTKQRLQINMTHGAAKKATHGLLHTQRSSAPHVWVGFRNIELTLDYKLPVMFWEIIHPIVAALSCDSGVLHHIQYQLPGTGSCTEFNAWWDDIICRDAAACLHTRCLDGAFANNKFTLYEHWLRRDMANHFDFSLQCTIHCVVIVNGLLTTSCYPGLLGKLFSASMFVRMGSFLLRMLMSVSRVVDEYFDVTFEKPDPSWRQTHMSIIGLLMFAHKCSAVPEAYVPDKDYYSDLLWMTTILNGPWWNTNKLLHYCAGQRCCKGKAESRWKVILIIMRIILRTKPVAASLKLWLSVDESMGWWLLPLLVCSVRHLSAYINIIANKRRNEYRICV